jgi:hypothetical protein
MINNAHVHFDAHFKREGQMLTGAKRFIEYNLPLADISDTSNGRRL